MVTKEIERLYTWSYPNTKEIPDGYDWKIVPDATPENMVIMMNKINELIECVNNLINNTGER